MNKKFLEVLTREIVPTGKEGTRVCLVIVFVSAAFRMEVLGLPCQARIQVTGLSWA